MATARISPSAAAPLPVRPETRAPAAPAPRHEAPPSRNPALPGSLGGLARRQSPVHGGTASLPAPRVALDRLSRAAQAVQPSKAAGPSVGRADLFSRLKAKLGRYESSAPPDENLFETSLQSGLVQSIGLKTVFGDDRIGVDGVCAGLSAIWLNVHCAVPDGNVDTRMRAVGSLEGIQHALVFQRSYMTNHEYLTRGSGPDTSLQSKAREDVDGLYGIERDSRPIKITGSTAKIAAMMADVDGYASLMFQRTDKAWKTSGHEMSMYRTPEDGMITFFDPNYGEFRFKPEDTAQFLRTLREKYRLKSDVSFDWVLTKVRPNHTDASTPLDVLVDYVKANQESPARS